MHQPKRQLGKAIVLLKILVTYCSIFLGIFVVDWLIQQITLVVKWLSALCAQPGFWLQLALVLIIVALSALLNSWLQRRLSQDHSSGLRHMAVRSSQRILFPALVAIALLIAAESFEMYKLPARVLHFLFPIALALAIIRLSLYVLRKIFISSPLVKAMEPMLATGIWLIVALHLSGLLKPLHQLLDKLAITLGSTRISLWMTLQFVLVVLLAFTVALWLSAIVNQRLKQVPHFSPSMQVGFGKFTKVFLLTIAFLIALSAVGINLSSLAIFGGALGVGLGFGLQRITSNFISGFILVMDRSVKPGDNITVGENFGWVEQMNSRYVVLRNRQGIDTLIPNENLITGEVINWSYADPNVRLEIDVQISYQDDPEQAMQLMLDCAFVSPRVLKNPEPSVRLLQFADSGMKLQLRVWIGDMENGSGSVRSEINLAIWRSFKAHGVTMPFPQREITIKSAPTGSRD